MTQIPDRPIVSIYCANTSESLESLTEKLLETAGLEAILPSKRSVRIGIKPNLVVASPADGGATTHPEIIAGIIRFLQKLGYDNLLILEGSWVGDRTSRAFKRCGYEKISKEHQVPLFDTQNDSSFETAAEGYGLSVCSVMESIDFLINVPVLKGHCQTLYTGALKNMKGCIPDSEKRTFHSKGLHEPIARLNQVIRQDCIVMDGICGDPTFEEGGSPSQMNRLLFATDPVLIDSYGASVLGCSEDEVPYIARSAELGTGNLWDGDEDAILEINEHGDRRRYQPDPQLAELSPLIDEREACSSCYASLISALRKSETPDLFHYAVGRYFRDGKLPENSDETVGVGICTSRFRKNIPGCPPTPEDILKALRK